MLRRRGTRASLRWKESRNEQDPISQNPSSRPNGNRFGDSADLSSELRAIPKVCQSSLSRPSAFQRSWGRSWSRARACAVRRNGFAGALVGEGQAPPPPIFVAGMAATAVATIEAARNIAAVERNCLPPPSFRCRRQMRTILADGEAFCVAPHLTQVQRHQMAFAARQTSEHACRDGHSMRQQTSRAAQMRARRRGDACGRAGGRKRGRGYSFLYTYSPPSGAYPLNSGKKAIRWPQNPSNPQ